MAVPTHQGALKEQNILHAKGCLATIRHYVQRIAECLQEDDTFQLETYVKSLEDVYNKLETLAVNFPDKMQPSDSLQRLANEYHEEFFVQDPRVPVLKPEANFGKVKIENYLDSINWIDSFQLYAGYNDSFIKMGFANRRRHGIFEIPPQKFTSYTTQNNHHVLFMTALANMQKEATVKRFGIWLNVLEQTPFGSIIELKTGNVVEKQTIVTQKTLIVENNGVLDMVLFIAPHEEWRHLDNFGEFGGRKLDLMQKSRFIVFQKITLLANSALSLFINSSNPNIIMNNIYTYLTKYHKIFELKCRMCGKVMKDFMPCIFFDPRSPANAMHESCRFTQKVNS